MASSFDEKMTPKPVVFKFQGVPSKSRFQDDYADIKDTNLGHDLGEFLRICNKPTERSVMISALIQLGLVNAASHPMSVQSSMLIMTLVQQFIPKERMVKSVTSEIVLDL